MVCDEPYFEEFTQACAEHLATMGIMVSVLDRFPQNEAWDAVLVVGIHKFMRVPFRQDVLVLGVQTEQLPFGGKHSGRLRRNLRRFQAVRNYYDLIFDWNPGLADSRFGGSVFVPYGCHATRHVQTEDKQWDIVFIGNVHHCRRRQDLLEFLGKQFSCFPDFSPGFGEARAAAIRKSRICLNIHYYEHGGFESPRVFDYLAQGGFVLSERAEFTWPFTAGRDMEEFADRNELVEKIRFYLQHKQARQEIARQGHETACAHDYAYAAGIMGSELSRSLASGLPRWSRWLTWSNARLRSNYMALRDVISVNRRRVMGQIET